MGWHGMEISIFVASDILICPKMDTKNNFMKTLKRKFRLFKKLINKK